ncbi:MAG: rod shape-determining protein MreC, partial [Dysgonamonadaceae bacterium]|nr:rod shape-determining protein MreC [Dysgonamonadaceae bacterium]
MRNLINFILKNVHWQLFVLLSFLSILLIVNNGLFQRSKFLAGVQELTGNFYSISSNIKSYINLRGANDDLLNRIAE